MPVEWAATIRSVRSISARQVAMSWAYFAGSSSSKSASGAPGRQYSGANS